MNKIYGLYILTTIITTVYGMENKYKALDPLQPGYTRVGPAQLPAELINDIHFLNNIKYDEKTKKICVNLPIKEYDDKDRRSVIAKIMKQQPDETIALLNTMVIHPKN